MNSCIISQILLSLPVMWFGRQCCLPHPHLTGEQQLLAVMHLLETITMIVLAWNLKASILDGLTTFVSVIFTSKEVLNKKKELIKRDGYFFPFLTKFPKLFSSSFSRQLFDWYWVWWQEERYSMLLVPLRHLYLIACLWLFYCNCKTIRTLQEWEKESLKSEL